MVMQDDKIVFHAIAKVAIIPGNPKVFHNIFKIFIFVWKGHLGRKTLCRAGCFNEELILNYDINIIVIAFNIIVLLTCI